MASGNFAFGVLAPGDYFVVALDEPFRVETVTDRRALDALVPLARRVSLQVDEAKTMDLALGRGARQE